jgi:hypothetical protein
MGDHGTSVAIRTRSSLYCHSVAKRMNNVAGVIEQQLDCSYLHWNYQEKKKGMDGNIQKISGHLRLTTALG